MILSPLSRGLALLLLSCSLFAPLAHADVNNYGQSGLINMPDARIGDDGATSMGMGFSNPYVPIFASMTVLPRIEMTFRYTRIMGIPGFLPGDDFGDYKDKAIDGKVVLWEESAALPQISAGILDIHGTRLLPAYYLVASKRFGDLDLTLGYGADRIDGVFGGLRWRPQWARGFGLILEQDAFDYQNDFRAPETRASRRDGGLTPAIEWRMGLLGARVSHEDGRFGGSVYMRIPWSVPEFKSKVDEPKPMFESSVEPRPRSEWTAGAPPMQELILALEKQDFGNIRMALHPDGMFEVKFNNRRITHVGRAVGRAARTIMLMGPEDMTGLRITYWSSDLPTLVYRFSDLDKLRGYFAGTTPPAEFAPTLTVEYATPEASAAFKAHQLAMDPDLLPPAETEFGNADYKAGAPLRVLREGRDDSRLYIRPLNLGTVFNDPTGVLKYDLFSTLSYGRRLGEGLFAIGGLRLTLSENTSESNQRPNNSLLPHVRTDLGQYLKEGPFKVNNLTIVKYQQLDERIYARYSAGLYEMMFAGAGAEVLWIPRSGRLSFAVTVEALRQRDFEGYFGFQDYSTVLALGTAYYTIPRFGVTLVARGGRFLAKDEGVRFEFLRQLRSGARFGLWYTVTNGNDITSPGTPSDPYRDKGVFIAIPFHTLVTKDTRGYFAYGMGAWNRDVGQISQGPQLYDQFQDGFMLNHDYWNPLSLFGQ